MAAKSKARVIIARLLSTAGTGYHYTTTRPRLADKLVVRKYDPKGEWAGERASEPERSERVRGNRKEAVDRRVQESLPCCDHAVAVSSTSKRAWRD